jgi:hypothetical protein
MDRRSACLGLMTLPLLPQRAWSADVDALALLRRGGVVLVLRHARAPGTFDPPGFQLGDCSTQRNLSEEGRAQARQLGAYLKAQQLRPSRVRSSPWCRCVDTAELAFGSTERWPALGSPQGGSEATNAQALADLRQAVVDAARRPGQFEVWVTHMFVQAALVRGDTASGEGLVVGPDVKGQPVILGTFAVPK